MTKLLTIGPNQIDPDTDVGQQALEQVHGLKAPVLCRCTSAGVPMYVARLEERYIVKRMPGTGIDHAPDCSAFEPPEHLSGLSELQGGAISESAEDGEVTLKLDFALTKRGKRAMPPPQGQGQATEAVSNPKKLGLTALLHFLWQEAELTKWVPAMERKRWWGVVASALRRASYGKSAKGLALRDVLFVPEAFKKETAEAAKMRRSAKLSAISSLSSTGTSMGLVIAEYKSHEPTRLGAKFIFKHLPDLGFFADADLTARFEKVFEDQLSLAGFVEGSKVIVIGSFSIAAAGYPVLNQIGMMLVDQRWLPFEHLRDVELLETAAAQGRRFVVQLRYNLKTDAVISSAVLSDTDPAVALFVAPPTSSAETHIKMRAQIEDTEFATWFWSDEANMPDLPSKTLMITSAQSVAGGVGDR